VGEVGENGEDVEVKGEVVTAVRRSVSGFISMGLCGAPKGEVTLSMR
jgi:hypothetical protein